MRLYKQRRARYTANCSVSHGLCRVGAVSWGRVRRRIQKRAEITKRRSGELVRGVLKILLKHPDGLPAKDVLRDSGCPPYDEDGPGRLF